MTEAIETKSAAQAAAASLLTTGLPFMDGFATRTADHVAENQEQTNAVFSEKWSKYASAQDQEKLYDFSKHWYLTLYGFDTLDRLEAHLRGCRTIFDAGSGLGYKAAWMAKMAPHALVIGMDYSDEAQEAARRYRDIPNLLFIQGDIADTPFKDGAFDYVSCDQVIMHTEDPEATFAELARITEPDHGQFACYFYAKKALPRELLDDYFRMHCKEVTTAQLWEMSEQLAELGKRLSALEVSFDAPAIPLLGIKGGEIDIQRFIYWNFLKCFWNGELGWDSSVSTNFDWYSPSNARRFSEKEVREIVTAKGMKSLHFHSEEAAHSGRFVHAR